MSQPNKVVSNADIASAKSRLAAVTSFNFRNDLNANGRLSKAEVAATKVKVGAITAVS